MKKLTDVLKREVKELKGVVKEGAIGTLKGLYSPFVMTSAYNNIDDVSERCGYDLKKGITHGFCGVMSGAISQIVIGSEAFEKGHGGTYLALLAATNTIDYLCNRKKRKKIITALPELSNDYLLRRHQ